MRAVLRLAAVSFLAGACGTPIPLAPVTTGSYRSFPRTARIAKTCLVSVTGQEQFVHHAPLVSFQFQLRQAAESALVEGLKQTCAATRVGPRRGAGSEAPLNSSNELGVAIDLRSASLVLAPTRYSDNVFHIDSSLAIERSPGEEPLARAVEVRSAQNATGGDLNSLVSQGLKDLADQVNAIIFENRERLMRVEPARQAGPT